MTDGKSDRKKELEGPTEKRTATRFEVKLPVEFHNGIGMTRDFSTMGAYFETGRSFHVGEPVEFTVGFAQSVSLRHSFSVLCRGEVVRVERGLDKTGVAVAINSHSFAKV